MRPVVWVGEAGKSEPIQRSVGPTVARGRVVRHGRQAGPEPGALHGLELPLAERTRRAVRITEDGYAGVGLLAQPTVRFLYLPAAGPVPDQTYNPMSHPVGSHRPT